MSKHIKALVVLNLQSYAGGRDLWGLRDPKRDAAKGWQTPIFNDGLIEVRSTLFAQHLACLRGSLHHWVRVASQGLPDAHFQWQLKEVTCALA